MNHIYRSIWSDALGVWMAVSEIAKGQGKRSSNRHKLLATGLLICSTSVLALPTGNQLVAGQAAVSIPNANSMQINQASQNAIINWQGFSVAPSEAVNIQQPNANAALLNRVVGQDASQIQGQLNANGQVYLVNPNGVLFSKTAQIDVGGLIATTHNITNADFLNGNHHFTQNGTTGTVDNQGTIKTPAGGVVALIGQRVNNSGTITTPKGTTALAAGKTVDLDFKGDGLVEVNVSEAALNAQINNKGAIQADGGRVILTTKAAGQLIDTVINQEGIVRAQGMVERNGEIILEGGYVAQTGTLDASGKTGGTVNINARAILDAGTTNADGTVGKGGNINMNASDAIIQTAAADTHANAITTGGTVHLEATNSIYSSGKLSVTGEQGGTIDAVSNDRVVLAAANMEASGSQKGGLIRVGGDFHGANANLPNAKTTLINGATKIKADGGEGQVVIWSNEKTDYYGSISANQVGNIEVSSKGTLTYAGSADAGVDGNLLLDPKNIIISATGGVASYELIDPHLAAGNQFGLNITLMENGNVVVSSPYDSFAANNAGAIHLFNTTTGALLATLTGSSTNDQVGINNGITALSNGNYVVSSTNWHNGTITNAGAVTWGNGLTGISGIVSSTNSLVGSTVNDLVGGFFGVTALTNGNYVVSSPGWDNGTIVGAGAVTWGNGLTGISGVVSSTNSLVGSVASDFVGSGGITVLTNGNYVVFSSGWDNGTIVDAGAITWGNGATGITGTISSTNSLIGSTSGDSFGSSITALTNGNYVVSSSGWDNGTIVDAGAVTWGNGLIGISGVVSSTNSLVGSIAGDFVGNAGITVLTNGNYVVSSSNSDNGTIVDAGAITWGNGLTGISGVVSSTNSLVGSTAGDFVGNAGITVLINSNYVVSSPYWNNGTTVDAGAVTWGNGLTGISGAVSSTNSLVGTTAYDSVGNAGITALTNGNYVVSSPYWNNGTIVSAGAATWGNGLTGISGAVSSTNSLVGSTADDFIGSIRYGDNGITALTNGNYVVSSPNWDNGTIVDVGAVTWGNGLTGISGAVSSTNSLVGTTVGDSVGNAGITALTNGNYVVSSPLWNNGTIVGAGAATWGNGSTGIIGAVSSTNSLVGTTAGDSVGSIIRSSFFITFFTNSITALTDGNYVVSSPSWSNGTITAVGAATWGNGSTGIRGTISSTNSLVGSTAFDNIGKNGITALNNGNYVVSSSGWDNGTINDAGAVTWSNGATRNNGIVSTSNSLTGSAALDWLTFNFVTPTALRAGAEPYLFHNNVKDLNNGNYLVSSGYWDNAGLINAGQVRIATPQNIFFNNGVGQTMTFNPSFITDTLASGTNVTLQANNDITLNAGADIIVNGNNGGNFTLQAGRNINLNASIRTANGDFTAIAGDPNATATDRDSGTPTITLGSGATIDAGTGKVILAAIGGNFINNSGSTKPITASQWLIYSTDPSQDILNGMTADGTHYDQTYTRSTPSYANTGNWFLYSNPITSTTTTVKSVETVIKAVKQVNLVDLNFWLSQLTPLQLSTTFLHDYTERLRDNNEEVDTDFGQYKGDVYSLKTEHYDWRKEHKKHKNRYVNLLLNIENGGIKLPVDSATSVKPIKF